MLEAREASPPIDTEKLLVAVSRGNEKKLVPYLQDMGKEVTPIAFDSDSPRWSYVLIHTNLSTGCLIIAR